MHAIDDNTDMEDEDNDDDYGDRDIIYYRRTIYNADPNSELMDFIKAFSIFGAIAPDQSKLQETKAGRFVSLAFLDPSGKEKSAAYNGPLGSIKGREEFGVWYGIESSWLLTV